MNKNSFSQLIAGLLKTLKIESPPSLLTDSFTLHFATDGDMHFINRIPEYLDIVTEVSVPGMHISNDKLLDLLKLNGLNAEYLSCSVSIHPASGTIVVVCRLPHEHLDLQTLIKMKDSVHAKVSEVKRIVENASLHSRSKNGVIAEQIKNLVQFNRMEKI